MTEMPIPEPVRGDPNADIVVGDVGAEKEIRTLSEDQLQELKTFNKNALQKEADESAFVILEMDRETGQQRLIAIPSYHTPAFGPPVVKNIKASMGEEAFKDFQSAREAAEYAEVAGAKVFYAEPERVHPAGGHVWALKDDEDPFDEDAGDVMWAVPYEDISQEDRDWKTPATLLWVQEFMPNSTVPLFRQIRDDDGNRVYHSQAIMFSSKEFAESWVKERGIEDYAYAIMEFKDVVIGENSIQEILKIEEEEHQQRIEHFEALRKAGAIVDTDEPADEE